VEVDGADDHDVRPKALVEVEVDAPDFETFIFQYGNN
jgi:hypothetical protein